MKNLLLACILIFSVVAAGAQDNKKKSRKERKAEQKAALIEQTKQLIDGKVWRFDADQMLPSQGRSRNLTTDYGVVLNTDKVDSYLPFFGRAYSASYGSSESPMIFESDAENYSVADGKKGGYIVKFSAKNGSDRIDFIYNVAENGSATLNVTSTNRASIAYYGKIVPFEKKEN
jgi:hypothetical protein